MRCMQPARRSRRASCPAAASLYLRSLKAVGGNSTLANEDQKTGVNIVRRAIQVPAKQIATNAGEDGSVVAAKVLENPSSIGGSTPKPANTAI